MFLDNNHFGIVDVAIALEIASKIDDGQPKPKLSDALKTGLARIWGRGAEIVSQADEERCAPSAPNPV
ncbi:MAG: hypothetical protein H7Y09_05345 [Chitinophagaceae bacterium]|nr:hypothetical protein [Anaerolineae bacterium]